MSSGAAWRQRKRQRLFQEQQGICHWCREPMTLSRPLWGKPYRNYATFDELLPRSRGGKPILSNQVLACKECNARRGNTIPEGTAIECTAEGLVLVNV